MTGAPGWAKWPTSMRRSVTVPPAGAITVVRARSSSAFSTAARALRNCALSSPLSPADFLRLAQVGLGALAPWLRASIARGLRDFQAAHRDRAGVFRVAAVPGASASFSAIWRLACGRLQRCPRPPRRPPPRH